MTTATPRRSQKDRTTKEKKNHASNGDSREAEDASLTAPSSSEPLPSNSEDSSSGVKSVAAGNESGEEVEGIEVVKKRKRIGKADEDADAKCLFPMNRIKMIAKSEGGDDMRLSHEAIFLLNKASEKFLELFCEEAYEETVNERKNHVAYHHLAARRLCFFLRFDSCEDHCRRSPERESATQLSSNK